MFCKPFINQIFFNFARKINKNIQPINPLNSLGTSTDDNAQIQEQFQPLSASPQVQQKIKQNVLKELSYEGQDPNPQKLVNRPQKGVVWGLGGQLVMASKKLQLQGLKPQTDQILQFLELQQVKNIYVHDWDSLEENNTNRRRFSIVGSCFSARHCWRTAIQLKNAFNKNVIEKRTKQFDPIEALMIGGKDDEFMLIEYKDFEISLMTEEQREAMDLQWKWNNPPSEESIEKFVNVQLDKKGRKRQFQDLD